MPYVSMSRSEDVAADLCIPADEVTRMFMSGVLRGRVGGTAPSEPLYWIVDDDVERLKTKWKQGARD